MAMHTQNLRAYPRASLLVTQTESTGDVLGASRVTLLGDVVPIEEPEVTDARRLYLASYENSKYWVDFDDFSFYRMKAVDVYYVDGFGVMGWVSAAEYERAQPDPLSDEGLFQHMNADHKEALALLSLVFAGIESQAVEMTSVDRLGFHVRAKIQDGIRGARIAFSREVTDSAKTRTVIVEMVQQARQARAGAGYNPSRGGTQ
jgi:hypothetical protein